LAEGDGISRRGVRIDKDFPRGRALWTDIAIEASKRFDCEQYSGRSRQRSDGEFKQFLNIAQGSTYEVQTQLLLTKQLKIGDEALRRNAELLSIEISKMLGAFLQSLKS